jgi:ATP-binding cassette subfamily C protein
MKSAITRLSEILRIGAARIPFGEIDDPLFRVCQLVGKTIGIEMKPHPDLIRGVKVSDPLRSILDASRVRSRTVILKGEWWKTDIGGPILAFKEKENRPVAIIPVTSTTYKMYDPVDDQETPVTAQAASLLNPAAHTFYRHFPDKKLTGMDLLKFGIHGLKSDIYMVLSMGLAAGLLALIVPIATGKIFDTIIPGAERGQLFQLTIALIVFAFATSMFQIVRGIAMIRIEGKMDASVQSAVWDRLLSLPVPFFSNYSTGDLAQRAMGINLIRQAASGVVGKEKET